MQKIFFLFFILFAVSVSKAQDEPQPPSHAAIKYYEARLKLSIPPYGYDKIQQLIDHIQSTDGTGSDDEFDILPESIYNRLSLREKFTYNMIHAEYSVQNCDIPLIETDADKKIYASPPDPFGEGYWSDRQTNFFKDNRDSVIALMKESIERSNRVGCNYKRVIIDLNATELIPVLVKVETSTHTDHDILSVLNLLMKAGNYKPFMQSASYQKLYGDESMTYKSFIYFNKENEALIIQRAMDFYNEQHH